MPVNFFDAHHTQSSQETFGLYDKPYPEKAPSYIMEEDKHDWIGIVNNPTKINADFYGLDHSLKIPVPPPNPDDKYIESLCDGMLKHGDNLSFVELKVWASDGKWIGVSTKQILNSVKLFAENHGFSGYTRVEGRICNKLKPALHRNCMHSQERFQEAAVLYDFKGELIVKQEIDI
ncbi:hypothetical protein [Chitinophaga filiformis]|uniref:hypothetical protein n=1 Tax=Chitinophaga filiformis TaxID=104663 RepID=UPI001F1A565F|nr:hypothetical protein [Chitinophaga filiformis]